jgi:YopX protein
MQAKLNYVARARAIVTMMNVFEGDILRIEYRDDDAPDIYTDDVCFDNSCWQMNVKATHKHPEHAPFSESANPEIIANIYEHPHLLTNEK